ncbi:hypothetical protein ILP97_47605 [Amycolatopsis sp. H6(2020)]|nr:hypothetical protein [Amycolatopsis sp. H6(2020)]
MHREIDDTTRMIKNLVRSLALFDRPTKDLVDEVNDERDTLHKRKDGQPRLA